MNYFHYIDNNFAYKIQNGTLYLDAKPMIKNTFVSSQNYLSDLARHPQTESEGGRAPMWVPVDVLSQFFRDKANSSRLAGAESFNFFDFKDAIFDFLYDSGLTQFVSVRRQNEEASKREITARQNESKLQQLEAELQRYKDLEDQRLQNELESGRININPVIKSLNSVWFPVVISAIFAVVIGGFSFEILSETMGLKPYLNVLLAVAYVMFPILTAIRQYTFDFGFGKVQPLWIVMIIDMVFTAYHVGWFHVGVDGEIGQDLHWIIKSVYVIIIPLMQKATNDMILKIRQVYLDKDWLPNIH